MLLGGGWYVVQAFPLTAIVETVAATLPAAPIAVADPIEIPPGGQVAHVVATPVIGADRTRQTIANCWNIETLPDAGAIARGAGWWQRPPRWMLTSGLATTESRASAMSGMTSSTCGYG